MNNINQLQEKLFGGLHNFHTERTAMLLEVLQEKFGDEVLDIVEKVDIDLYGLYYWHLKRTVNVIVALKNKYGESLIDEVAKTQNAIRYNQGKQLALQLPNNSLEDIIPFFTFGHDDWVTEKTNEYAIIKTPKCMIGDIINSIDNSNIAYCMHCGTDKYFTEGFNSCLSCDVIQSIAEGYDCCIHRIYVTQS